MARSHDIIRDDMIQSALNRGIGSYAGSGSVLRELLDIQAYQVSRLENQVDNSEKASHMSEAEGIDLDKFGADLQLPRLLSQRATTLASDFNVRMYTANSINFEDLAGGLPTIAPGQRLSNRDGTKTYVITQVSPSVYNTETEIFLGVKSIVDGTEGNTPPHTITTHALASYGSSILVDNRFAIYNGSEVESDANYLARLTRQMNSLEACNETSIASIVSQFSGIGKHTIVHSYSGLGSIAVIVQPALGILNVASLLIGLQTTLRSRIAAGTIIHVKNPDLKHIGIQTKLRTSTLLNASEKLVLINRVQQRLITFFNTLQIGRSVSVRELALYIRQADARITGVGENPDRIDVVSYTIVDGSSSYSRNLTVDDREVTADIDELIVLDDTTALDIAVI